MWIKITAISLLIIGLAASSYAFIAFLNLMISFFTET